MAGAGNAATARDNSRVNAICPGAVRTAMLESGFAPPETRAQLAANHPIGWVAQAEEAAAAACYWRRMRPASSPVSACPWMAE